MRNPLLKYKLGLLVLGLFTVGMVVLVVVQAGATKQDAETTRTAQEIADKLNEYVVQNQVIPDSLSEVGATDVPATMQYTKLSDTSYRFCITYKTSVSSFNAGTALQEAASGYSRRLAGTSQYGLVIPSTHNKGEVCQTIEPPLVDTSLCGPTDGSGYQNCSEDGSDGSNSGSTGTPYLSR